MGYCRPFFPGSETVFSFLCLFLYFFFVSHSSSFGFVLGLETLPRSVATSFREDVFPFSPFVPPRFYRFSSFPRLCLSPSSFLFILLCLFCSRSVPTPSGEDVFPFSPFLLLQLFLYLSPYCFVLELFQGNIAPFSDYIF